MGLGRRQIYPEITKTADIPKEITAFYFATENAGSGVCEITGTGIVAVPGVVPFSAADSFSGVECDGSVAGTFEREFTNCEAFDEMVGINTAWEFEAVGV